MKKLVIFCTVLCNVYGMHTQDKFLKDPSTNIIKFIEHKYKNYVSKNNFKIKSLVEKIRNNKDQVNEKFKNLGYEITPPNILAKAIFETLYHNDIFGIKDTEATFIGNIKTKDVQNFLAQNTNRN